MRRWLGAWPSVWVGGASVRESGGGVENELFGGRLRVTAPLPPPPSRPHNSLSPPPAPPDTEAKYQALQEESRLYSEQHEANRSSIAMLSEMLEETRIELEKYKSSKIHGRLEQRRALLRQLTLDSSEASPGSPQSPRPDTAPVKPEPTAVNGVKKGRGPAD